MLRARLSETRIAVSLHDPAITQIDMRKLYKYKGTRNIIDLGDITNLKNPLTIFHLEAMLPHYQAFAADEKLDMLFAIHCSKIENGPVTDDDFENDDGRISLKFESRTKVPYNTTIELGEVIRQLASVDGAVSPFSPQVGDLGWQTQIRDQQAHDALYALTDTTAEKTPGE